MRIIRLLTLPILAAAIYLGAGTRLAAAENHFLTLTRPMVEAGVNLRPAVYNLQWELQGRQATVRFQTKGRVVATVQGILFDLGKTPAAVTLYTSKHPDGFTAINGLGIAGSSQGIIFPAFGTRRQREGDAAMTGEALESLRNQPPQARAFQHR